MATRIEAVTGRLREAMNVSGQSRYALWKATGISQSTLSRFSRGIGVLNAEAIDTLAAHFGLVLMKESGKATKEK